MPDAQNEQIPTTVIITGAKTRDRDKWLSERVDEMTRRLPRETLSSVKTRTQTQDTIIASLQALVRDHDAQVAGSKHKKKRLVHLGDRAARNHLTNACFPQ